MKRAGPHPGVPASDDLLGQAAIKELVREAYRGVVGATSSVAYRLYDPAQLALLSPGAIAQALGVGNPVRAAKLRPGEIVIDLGCGGGIDTILAARAVEPGGKAIGLDMLPELLAVAAANAKVVGVTNVEWLLGELEAIPLPDETVDVAISNGVVNLSPRKSRVFAEVYRILRRGGRFVAADIVVDDDLPPEIFTNPAAWAGCLSGALAERVFVSKLKKIGFTDVQRGEERPFGIDDCTQYPVFTAELLELMRRHTPRERWSRVARSVIFGAWKAGPQG